MAFLPVFVILALSMLGVRAQTYSATYQQPNLPNQTEQGQSGTNQCGTGSNQTSQCQNAYRACYTPLFLHLALPTLPNLVNSVDDWCIFGPPDSGPGSVIGNTEVCKTNLDTASDAEVEGLL